MFIVLMTLGEVDMGFWGAICLVPHGMTYLSCSSSFHTQVPLGTDIISLDMTKLVLGSDFATLFYTRIGVKFVVFGRKMR